MSIIREFEVFLTETVCCFRCCLSVVSVLLVVVFDSFGRVWHLSCVLFRLVYILLILFSGEHKPTGTTHKTDARLPNEPNPTTNTTETTDKQQRKQQTVSVKNTSNSVMMDIHCPKHVGVLTMVHRCFNKFF
jgi:hypothetical protein